MRHLYLFMLCLPLVVGCGTSQNTDATVVATEPTIPYDSLRIVLEKALATDQGIREKLTNATTAEEQMALMPEMQRIDSTNLAVVGSILEQYGWLPQSKLGEEAASSLFYVVQHSNLSTMERYFPMLKQKAQEGEASKVHAAMMEDRILMWQGKKQIYGTQATTMGRKDGKMAIWPIEDPENVNKRRAEVGMANTIEENAARLEAVYDPQAELPNRN